jgi:type IV secretory pathway TrbF-like protein
VKKQKIEKPNVPEKIEQVDPNHPYYYEIKGYLDLRSYDRVTIASQRNFIFILLIVIIIESIGLILIGKASKYIPMVFYSDRYGSLVYGGIAQDSFKVTDQMIGSQLDDYIIGLRQVPKDINVRTEYVRKVKMMTTTDLYNQVTVPNYEQRYKEDAPLIYVAIKSTLQINKTTYQIDWEEDDGGKITKWKASISLTLNNETDDPVVKEYNPAGILVNGININQVVQ